MTLDPLQLRLEKLPTEKKLIVPLESGLLNEGHTKFSLEDLQSLQAWKKSSIDMRKTKKINVVS